MDSQFIKFPSSGFQPFNTTYRPGSIRFKKIGYCNVYKPNGTMGKIKEGLTTHHKIRTANQYTRQNGPGTQYFKIPRNKPVPQKVLRNIPRSGNVMRVVASQSDDNFYGAAFNESVEQSTKVKVDGSQEPPAEPPVTETTQTGVQSLQQPTASSEESDIFMSPYPSPAVTDVSMQDASRRASDVTMQQASPRPGSQMREIPQSGSGPNDLGFSFNDINNFNPGTEGIGPIFQNFRELQNRQTGRAPLRIITEPPVERTEQLRRFREDFDLYQHLLDVGTRQTGNPIIAQDALDITSNLGPEFIEYASNNSPILRGAVERINHRGEGGATYGLTLSDAEMEELSQQASSYLASRSPNSARILSANSLSPGFLNALGGMALNADLEIGQVPRSPRELSQTGSQDYWESLIDAGVISPGGFRNLGNGSFVDNDPNPFLVTAGSPVAGSPLPSPTPLYSPPAPPAPAYSPPPEYMVPIARSRTNDNYGVRIAYGMNPANILPGNLRASRSGVPRSRTERPQRRDRRRRTRRSD